MITRPSPRRRRSMSAIICFALAAAVTALLAIGHAEASDPPLSATSANGLVINEIYDSTTTANEYFELYNTGSAAINLSTYRIYNRDGFTPLSNLSDPNIAPGQFRVIGPTQLGTPTIAGSGLARTDFLALRNTSPSDVTVDVVNFGGSPNPNWPNYDIFSQYFFTSNIPQLPPLDADGNSTKSLQRWPDGVDTDQGTDFAQILSSPGAPSCADPFESDDTSATARSQDSGSTVLHRLCPTGDQDWISIAMSTGSIYTLQTAAQGARVDTVLRLYDSSGNLVAQDNNSGRRDSTIAFQPSASGTFRAQITDANNAGGAGSDYLYTFSITSTSSATATPATPTAISCTDDYEVDNSRQQAKAIELNTEQLHSLCPVGDQDWLTFTAVAGKVYSIYTKDLTGPVDTVITLYDSQGNFLFENDDYQPGQGLASRIDYTFGSTAVYYLRIKDKRNSGGAGYQYRVGLSSTGALPATATATSSPTFNPNSPTPTSAACGDSYEPDGVPEAAKLFLIGSTQQHSICPATDADWVRFYARAGKVYSIRTGNLGIGLDTYMYLFNSDGRTILAQNDDAGDGGVASRIDFYPLRDDWYYVQVKNAGDIGSPEQTYELSLAVSAGVPQPASTATAGANGAPPRAGTQPAAPTTVVQTPKPPVPTPTLVGSSDTPEPTEIAPLETTPETTPQPGPAATSAVPVPTEPASTEPGGTEATPTEQVVVIPGVPPTGHDPASDNVTGALKSTQPKPRVIYLKPAGAPLPVVQYAPIAFRLFYDRDRSNTYGPGEGIRGIDVHFLAASGIEPAEDSTLVTSDGGIGRLQLAFGEYKVFVPYLGMTMDLTRFPERELHALWLPPVTLPSRVP